MIVRNLMPDAKNKFDLIGGTKSGLPGKTGDSKNTFGRIFESAKEGSGKAQNGMESAKEVLDKLEEAADEQEQELNQLPEHVAAEDTPGKTDDVKHYEKSDSDAELRSEEKASGGDRPAGISKEETNEKTELNARDQIEESVETGAAGPSTETGEKNRDSASSDFSENTEDEENEGGDELKTGTAEMNNKAENQQASAENKEKEKDSIQNPLADRITEEKARNRGRNPEKISAGKPQQKTETSPRGKEAAAPQYEPESSEDQKSENLNRVLENQQKETSGGKEIKAHHDKAEQLHSKRREKHFSAFTDRQESNGLNSRKEAGWMSDQKTESNQAVSGSGADGEISDGEDFKSQKEETFWQRYEVGVSREEKELNAQTTAFSRLGQLPVTNLSIRRNLMPGLTQTVLKAAGQKPTAGGQWQKHNFVMEDGKSISLSTRKVDGVLQLKVSSAFSDITKILQQYQNEIRAHLEKVVGIEINLELANHDEGGGLPDFFGNTSSSEPEIGGVTSVKPASDLEQTEKKVTKTVRLFGYNRMEWTA